MYQELRQQRIEDVLEKVSGLSAVGNETQMRSIMAVPVKCTMDLVEELRLAGKEIRSFNDSTSRLTKVLIVLNVILAAATVVGAIAAFK